MLSPSGAIALALSGTVYPALLTGILPSYLEAAIATPRWVPAAHAQPVLTRAQPLTARQIPMSPLAQTKPRRQGTEGVIRFRFRVAAPQRYILVPATIPPAASALTPTQILELWQRSDYRQRSSLTETPPLITIAVCDRQQPLPLTTWKGALSRNDDRPLTVAGQPAIAYTSTGLYESDNVLFTSPDGQQVVRLSVGYLMPTDSIRQTFQEILASFQFEPASKLNLP